MTVSQRKLASSGSTCLRRRAKDCVRPSAAAAPSMIVRPTRRCPNKRTLTGRTPKPGANHETRRARSRRVSWLAPGFGVLPVSVLLFGQRLVGRTIMLGAAAADGLTQSFARRLRHVDPELASFRCETVIEDH